MTARSKKRTWLLRVLTVLTFVLAVAATVMVFAQDRLFDADAFGATVGATTTDPAVNDYLAEAMSNALIDQAPNLAIVGPVLERLCGGVLQSAPATQLLEEAAAAGHTAILTGRDDSLLMNLSDLVVSIDDALTSVNPDFADVIDDNIVDLSVRVSAGEIAPGAVRLAERLRFLTVVLVGLTAVALLALVALESTLFRGLTRMGGVLGLVGLFLVVVRAVGAAVIGTYGRTAVEADALTAVWNIVLGDLRTWGWTLIVVGAVLAGLGTAVVSRGRAVDAVRERWSALTAEDAPIVERVGATVAAFAAAVWALVHPTTALATVVRILGFVAMVLVVARVARGFGLADRFAAVEPDGDEVVPLGSIAKRLVMPTLVMVGLGVVGFFVLASTATAVVAGDPDACNGHRELCDRRLDEVAFATSHNSMSSTASAFYLPNHLASMRAQLNHGVRGFMIDTVYGRPASDGSVRTSVDNPELQTLGEAVGALVDQVRNGQGPELGDELVYLCHAVCEIGSLGAVDELMVVREWLDEHPREVVVFIVQDGTSPEDTAAVFEQAGYTDMIHTQVLGEPFPTLGEMVASGRRVFVMVEEDGGDVPWLHAALDFTQETPFSFASVDEFSCAPNRGSADAPLFVINHFITLARPANQTINDIDVLGPRVDQCAGERGLLPNFIAVDFVAEGDVMQVVDRLNGMD